MMAHTMKLHNEQKKKKGQNSPTNLHLILKVAIWIRIGYLFWIFGFIKQFYHGFLLEKSM